MSGSCPSRHFQWSYPTEAWNLSPDQVHVWVADIEHGHGLPELAKTLSRDEEERAARFHFKHDRKNFIATRGLLRAMLSSYTDLPATALQFGYSANGKPFLENVRTGLTFNVSHSGGLAVYAFSYGRDLGIDIERVEDFSAMDDVANRCFLAEEKSALKLLNTPQREENFFRYWTRKEAQLKCTGEGISGMLATEGFEGTLLELVPAEGYLGALAVRGHPFTLQTWQWRS